MAVQAQRNARPKTTESRAAHKLNFELTARRLVATNISDALRCATDIRERIEIVHTSEYANFLRHLFPAFRNILLHSPATHRADGVDVRFRHLVLEILNRLPNNEVLRPYAPELLRIATETLSRDTEENALTCLRIIFDLHKNFRPALEGEVQCFLDLVQRIYRLLPTSINKAFFISLPDQRSPAVTASDIFNRPSHFQNYEAFSASRTIPEQTATLESAPRPQSAAISALQGLDSFKVLTECPLIVMLLFQLYPKYIQENIPLLTPLMMGGLALHAPILAHKFQRNRYKEFIACQVKTLSFLTYLLRGFSELMKPYEEAISRAVITLMNACPGDAVSTRKELLVATRHILATEFRRGFYQHIDTLLDENVLIGVGHPSRDTLRPLAFSTLADLVHHVRAELSISQLSRVVLLFSRNLHDPALPLNVQTTSVRLLLNLVDFIFHSGGSEKAHGKRLLVHIMKSLVAKFDTLRFHMIKINNSVQRAGCDVICRQHNFSKCNSTTGRTKRSSITTTSDSTPADAMADVRPLIQTLIRGLKTVIWCISHYSQNSRSKPNNLSEQEHGDKMWRLRKGGGACVSNEVSMRTSANNNFSCSLSHDEAETIGLFFYWGLICCRVIASGNKVQKKELKEILDNFASAFTVLDHSNILSTVGQHVPMLFDAMLESPSLLAISQTLLANSNVSATFADILIRYLMGKLSELSSFELSSDHSILMSQSRNSLSQPTPVYKATSKDIVNSAARVSPPVRASTLLRLFRIILGSVALFPQNEIILRDRLRVLACACLQHAVVVDEPMAYYLLLRSIFRSVSSCLAPEVFEVKSGRAQLGDMSAFVLTTLIQQRSHVERSSLICSILTELCMTVPMALAKLVPFLPRLLPLVASAVQIKSGDLPSLGLRTFEYYLDHLGPVHLISLMRGQPQLHALMMIGVCSHLRPAPYALGTIALRILGKLGGLNRRFLELSGGLLPSLGPAGGAHCGQTRCNEKNSLSMGVLLRWRGLPCEWLGTPSVSELPPCNVNVKNVPFLLSVDPYVIHVCELLYSLVRCGLEKKTGPSTAVVGNLALVHRYQILCFRLLSCILCSSFELPVWPQHSDTSHRGLTSSAKEPTNNKKFCTGDPPANPGSNTQLCRLLYLILCATAHPKLEPEGTPLLQSLSFIFALLLHSSYDCGSEVKGTALVRGEGDTTQCKAAEEKNTIPTNGRRKRKYLLPAEKQSMCAFTSTLLEAVSDRCFRVANAALGALKYHMGCVYFLELQTPGAIAKPRSQLITDLISRICLSLREWDLPSRRNVSQILYQLLTTFGHAWARPNKHILAGSLLSSLALDDFGITLLSQGGVAQALHALLQTACAATNEIHLLVHILAREISSLDPAVRLGAQSGLFELNRLAGLPLMSSNFMKPIAPKLTHILMTCHLNPEVRSESAVGALDALSYIMSLEPCPILPSIELQDCLLQCIQTRCCTLDRTSKYDDENHGHFGWTSHSVRFSSAFSSCLLYHNTSSSLTHPDRLQGAALRATHSMVRAAKRIAAGAVKESCRSQDVGNDYDKFMHEYIPPNRQRKIIEVALISMTLTSVNMIVHASVSLLQETLVLGESSHADTCDRHMNAFMVQVPLSLTNISLWYLNKLNKLLLLPAARKMSNGVLTSSLLSRLEDFCHPEKMFTIRSWANTHPLELATKCIMLITRISCHQPHEFNILPILTSVVTLVLRLEALIPTYFRAYSQLNVTGNVRHFLSWHAAYFSSLAGVVRLGFSPFRAPLAQLLSSHASTATQYFLSFHTLADPHCVSLLRGLLHIKEAGDLRARILSTEGMKCLLNAAFKNHIAHIADTCFARKHFRRYSQDKQGFRSCRTDSRSCQSYNSDAQSFAGLSTLVQDSSWAHIAPTKDVPSAIITHQAQFHGLQLIITLYQLDPCIFTRHRIIGKILVSIWRTRLQPWMNNKSYEKTICAREDRSLKGHTQVLNVEILRNHKETFLIIQGLIGCCRSHSADIHVLFDMLSVFILPSPIDFTFLRDFYSREVALTWSPNHKRSIMLYFLRVLADQGTMMELNVMALRLIVTPMLVSTFEGSNLALKKTDLLLEKTCIVDSGTITLFMRCALDNANCKTQQYSEALRVELLKLTTVLIEHLGPELVEHRKDLIKFAWNHLKSDGSLSKQWAYVNVCRFVATYETPPKIILQVYVALLRTFQPEARELVKVALDILIPALPKRLPINDFVKAVKWTKKIMYEEGHALAQLVHMWQLVVRHPGLFFPYRSQFMPQMVNSLNRLGLPPNCPVENRQLAVALADLIMNWEYKIGLKEFCVTAAEKNLAPIVGSPTQSQIDDDFHLTMTMIEMVANFLVRLALFASDNKELAVQQLAPRCLLLFDTTLRAWPNAHIRFSYFEKIIATSNARLDVTMAADPPYSPTLLLTCLEIMHITLGRDARPNTFFIDNISKAQMLICPCFFYVRSTEVQLKLQGLLSRIVVLYPPVKSCNSTMMFYQRVKYVIESRLITAMENHSTPNRHGDCASAASFKLVAYVLPIIKVIDSACKSAPAYVLNHGHQLLRVGQILIFQHLNSIRKNPLSQSNACHATPTLSVLTKTIKSTYGHCVGQPDITGDFSLSMGVIDAILIIFSLLAQAVTDSLLLGMRRELVVLVFVCLERSDSTPLVRKLSKLVSGWLVKVKSPLSRKEQTAFIEHMLDIDNLADATLQPLHARFLCALNQTSKGTFCQGTGMSQTNRFSVGQGQCQGPSTVGLLTLHPGVRATFRSLLMHDVIKSASHHVIKMFDLDWSPLSNRFWLVILIEVILDGLDADGPVRLTTQFAQTPSLFSELFLPRSLETLICFDVNLQRQYTTARCCFLQQCGSLKNFIEPLKELVHAHVGLAERFWIDILPHVCCSVKQCHQRQWQIALTNSIFTQFASPHSHPKLQVPAMFPLSQVYATSNDARFRPSDSFSNTRIAVPSSIGFPLSFIDTVFTTTSVPRVLIQGCKFPLPGCFAGKQKAQVLVRMLSSAAARHNCHHAVLHIIEEVFMMRQSLTLQHVSRLPELHCASLFSSLQETDMQVGLLADSCINPMSSIAFSLRRYGFIPQAQHIFVSTMVTALRQTHHDATGLKPLSSCIFEADVWCAEWLACARDMSQWLLLSDLFKYTPAPLPSGLLRPTLRLEASWKSHKWDNFRKHLNGSKQPKQPTPQLKLLQARLAVVEGLYSDVEDLCGECIQLALESWSSLPKPRMGVAVHDQLLHLFHELIEVHESSQLLHEASQHSRAFTYPDLSTITHTWRNRLPNAWDSMSNWDDIMRWREHIFLSVEKAFAWGAANKILRLHDAPWTMVTLERIARKQGLRGGAQYGSNHLNDIQMNIDNAFCNVRERLLSFCSADDRMFRSTQAGLNFIDNMVIEVFSTEQRAELFRLKGVFLGMLGRFRDAHCAFSVATRGCSNYGRAWYSWAVLCDLNCSTEASLSSVLLNRLVKNSFLCYLAAIECGHQDASVCGLARILCLLQHGKQPGELRHLFHLHSNVVPTGALLPWIPQLLSMLALPEVLTAVCSLASSTPQAIFYALKSEMSQDESCDVSQTQGNKLISSIYSNNSVLAIEMDTLGDEMVLTARPGPSEELLHLLRCVSRELCSSARERESNILYMLLHKVSSKYVDCGCLQSLDMRGTWVETPTPVRNVRFPSYHLSLTSYLDTLTRILANRTIEVVSTRSCKYPFSTLSRLQSERKRTIETRLGTGACFLEVPGQYTSTFGLFRPELHLPLIQIDPSACLRVKNGKSGQHFAFSSDEGQVQVFASSITPCRNAQADERVSQFLGVIDFALVRCKTAQQRRLRVSPFSHVRFGPNFTMTEDRWSWTSLYEIAESRSSALGQEKCSLASFAQIHTQTLLSSSFSLKKRTCASSLKDTRRAIYNKVCGGKLSMHVLATYVRATHDGFEGLWSYRRTFATQLAIPSILGFVLAIGPGGTQETMFCQHTGRVHFNDFRPAFSFSRPASSSGSVPFRLTRNIERLLQPFLLHSIFKTTIGTILLAMRHTLEPGGLLEPYICLFVGAGIDGINHARSQGCITKIFEEKRMILDRVLTIAPPLKFSPGGLQIEIGLTKLIHLAQSPDCIAINAPNWEPWL